ncbi:MAG: hypothetical protein KGY74_09830 [Candidatus Cloacimonetes bacterium]|nr:hypothetical protein [Candidatus Cloacimonadota bacterium]
MIFDINSTAQVFFDIFLSIWVVLDAMFHFIDLQFTNVFSAIPADAIPFLMGIVLLSIIEFFAFFINRMETGQRRVVLKVFYALLGILLFLITIWRLGIVSQIERSADFTLTLTEFFIFGVYAIFVFAIAYSFWKGSGEKVRKWLLLVLWLLFTLVTWVIAPILQYFELSYHTLTQFLLVAVIFAIPQGLTSYQAWQKKGV